MSPDGVMALAAVVVPGWRWRHGLFCLIEHFADADSCEAKSRTAHRVGRSREGRGECADDRGEDRHERLRELRHELLDAGDHERGEDRDQELHQLQDLRCRHVALLELAPRAPDRPHVPHRLTPSFLCWTPASPPSILSRAPSPDAAMPVPTLQTLSDTPDKPTCC